MSDLPEPPSPADHDARCGDPSCELCVPPGARCETCGALTWGSTVPFCSAECAGAGEDAPPGG